MTFFVIGLLASGIVLLRAPKPLTPRAIHEALFSYFLLFSIGVSFFYNFIMHTFFGAMSARFIGWADSPFQAEVGFASLGYAVVGFLAFRGSFGLRLAAVIGPSSISARRRCRPSLSDRQDSQFRARQFGRSPLQRYPDPRCGPRFAMAAVTHQAGRRCALRLKPPSSSPWRQAFAELCVCRRAARPDSRNRG